MKRFRPHHTASTAPLGLAHPFLCGEGLGQRGLVVGTDQAGGLVCFDPFELYASGALAGPGVAVMGEIGRGKSSLVKSLVLRQVGTLGRRAVIISPKRGEYDALAAALGTTTIRLGGNSDARLNPLDAPGLTSRLRAARTVARAALARALAPAEDAALAATLTYLGDGVTLPMLVESLLSPHAEVLRSRWRDSEQWTEETRELALGLDRFARGDAAGVFDAPTRGVALDAALVVLDLSALAERAAASILISTALAGVSAAISRESDAEHEKRLVVVDEAWRVLPDEHAAEALLDLTKHARAYGVCPLIVMHRASDLVAAGDAGTRLSRIAEGLLADCETRICFAQPPDQAAAAAHLLGLPASAANVLPRLRTGEAIWRVGARTLLVRHALTETERGIIDTDARMLPDAHPASGRAVMRTAVIVLCGMVLGTPLLAAAALSAPDSSASGGRRGRHSARLPAGLPNRRAALRTRLGGAGCDRKARVRPRPPRRRCP